MKHRNIKKMGCFNNQRNRWFMSAVGCFLVFECLVFLRRPVAFWLIACCLLAICVGCTSLPNYEEIDKLRILAVRVDKPQLFVDAIAQMDALVVTPDDAEVALSWQLCAYVLDQDTLRECPAEAVIASGTGDTFDFSIDPNTATELGALCNPDESLVSVLHPNAQLPVCGDSYFPLTIRLTAQTPTESQVAIKKVFLLNALPEQMLGNPVIEGFVDLPKSLKQKQGYEFSVQVEGDDDLAKKTDTYPKLVQDDDDDEEEGEGLRYAWFVRGADMKYFLDNYNDDLRPEKMYLKAKTGISTVTVWVVVRSNWIGVDWRRIDFLVVP